MHSNFRKRHQDFPLKRLILTLLLIPVLLLGFDEGRPGLSHTGPVKNLDVKPSDAVEQNLSDIVADVEYIQLQLPKGEYIGEIQKVIFNESSIVVLDIIPGGGSYKIFCFDQSGKFRFVIDKQGRGPEEYQLIYDFDVCDEFIVISAYDKLMYYDLHSGAYIKQFDKPDFFSIQMIGMLEPNVVLSDEGRYKSNTSKKQVKIIDLEKGELIFETLPFSAHSLKIGHTYRYMYRYKDSYSVIPMYKPAIYRVTGEADSFSVDPAYHFNFGKYWIDEDILANSYNDRPAFFASKREYVNTIEIFETEYLIYACYKLQTEDYIYIYDKKTGQDLNISGFTRNNIGWMGKPIGTMGNSIVNSIARWEAEGPDIEPGKELKSILDNASDEGHPVLVKTRFKIID